MQSRCRWGAVLALAMVLMACDTDEVRSLDVLQAELDSQLIAKQTLVNQFQAVANRRAELVRLVADRAKADLGSDPRLALQRAIPAAADVAVVEEPGPSFLLAGSGRTCDLLAQLRQLAQSQPGLVLTRLAIAPSGFTAQLTVPPAVSPLLHSEPRPLGPPPPLPPEPLLESSRARTRRARIRQAFAEVTQLDKLVIPLEEAQRAVAHDEQVVRDASTGDRLRFALESAEVFFAGSPPWFAQGELDLHGNDVDFSAPDPGSPEGPRRAMELLHVRFTEPRVERANGRLVMHLTRQPIGPGP